MNMSDANSLAAQVRDRVAQMTYGEKTRSQIAHAAGFESVDTLIAIEAGRIKLPLDRAVGLADALGLDRRDLTIAALGQYVSSDLVDLLIRDPELEAARSESRAAVVAAEVEVAVIGSQARELETHALKLVHTASDIIKRREVLQGGLRQLLAELG
jgi:hypothetical protein